MIAIGIGCRRNTPAHAIEDLVRQAMAQAIQATTDAPSRMPVMVGAGGPPTSLPTSPLTHADPPTPDRPAAPKTALFTIEDKANEPGLIEAARTLNLSLTFLPRTALQAQPVHTRSPRAEARSGVPSVAEAAALAGAGPSATLIVPRITAHGVTCAIAR